MVSGNYTAHVAPQLLLDFHGASAVHPRCSYGVRRAQRCCLGPAGCGPSNEAGACARREARGARKLRSRVNADPFTPDCAHLVLACHRNYQCSVNPNPDLFGINAIASIPRYRQSMQSVLQYFVQGCTGVHGPFTTVRTVIYQYPPVFESTHSL